MIQVCIFEGDEANLYYDMEKEEAVLSVKAPQT